MSRLKVLMFGWEFPPRHSGGLGVACFGLTRAMEKEGVDVVFVLPRKQEVTADFARVIFADNESTVGAEGGGMSSTLFSGYATKAGYARWRGGRAGGMYGMDLFEEVERYAHSARAIALAEQSASGFDIIHAHDWLSFSAGLSAREATGKPLILHVHSTEFDRTGGVGADPRIRDAEARALRSADGIIAVSEFTKQKIIQEYGVSADMIEVVHNGIDDEGTHATSSTLDAIRKAGNRIVLFVGRITVQKGVEYLLRSAKQVLKFQPNTYFIIAGTGDMAEYMMMEAGRLGIAEKVIFAGAVTTAEAQSLYSGADVCVMPSVSEPFGLVALESAMQGTPVIISKQSGVSETMCHMLKVDFWDVDSMTNQIVGMLRHPALLETLAREAKKETRHLTWKSSARVCVDAYKKFISAHSG